MDDTAAADLFDGAAAHYDSDLFHATVAHALIDCVADVGSPRLVLETR